jgi:hypothetical protein
MANPPDLSLINAGSARTTPGSGCEAEVAGILGRVQALLDSPARGDDGYAGNDPVNNVDPDGMRWKTARWTITKEFRDRDATKKVRRLHNGSQ